MRCEWKNLPQRQGQPDPVPGYGTEVNGSDTADPAVLF
jgi:hypothetical protein